MINRNTLISILNYNGASDTIACLKSFYTFENPNNYCIVIWDNDSRYDERSKLIESIKEIDVKKYICQEDEYENLSDLKHFDLIVVLSNENYGFAKGNNRVLEKHLNDFSYSILLNNDTEFVENTAENLIHYLEKNDNVGVVTSSIYYYSDKERLWNAGGRIFCGTRKYYLNKDVQIKLERGINEMSADYITGCFLVVKNTVLREHGLLTEKFFFGEEDYEFCRRMKEKKIILKVLLNEKIYHKVGATVQKDINVPLKIRLSFIHHLNRFVDMKSFQHRFIWKIWKCISSIYIFFLMLRISSGDFCKIFRYIQLLNRYSNTLNSVDRDFFISVRNGEIV